jgi:hypothetical protein
VKPKNFVKFGSTANDEIMSKGDDNHIGPIAINNENKIYIYTNGLISFDEIIPNSHLIGEIPSNISFIAPFWTDASTLSSGEIFYRKVSDNESLNQISDEISKSVFNDPYQMTPTWAFVVTWYRVLPHGWPNADMFNTFQLVLAVDEAYSFVIFNYETLKWPNRKLDKPVQTGYSLNSLNAYLKMNQSIELTDQSNVDVKGKFIFRIQNPSKFKFKNYKLLINLLLINTKKY